MENVNEKYALLEEKCSILENIQEENFILKEDRNKKDAYWRNEIKNIKDKLHLVLSEVERKNSDQKECDQIIEQ
jgi:hypothetical protein